MIRIVGISSLPSSARRPDLIRAACRKAFQSEGRALAGALTVLFADRRRMLAINKAFLGHSYDTDVIAFPYDEPEAGAGDIIVSAHMARRQARELGHPVLREVLTLVLHGSLHLLGYDDHRPRDRRRMFAKQDRLLDALSLKAKK
jgi:probable rRNA maturation factor